MSRILLILLLALASLFAADQDQTAAGAAAKNAAFLKSLPDAQPTVVDQQSALALVTLPLSCVDHPQTLPETRTDYLWIHNDKPHTVEDYDKTRVFYGCSDWHSAVHSIWALVAIAKQYPQIPVAALIKDRLKDHLGKKNIEGEMEFLKGAKKFEIP